MTGRRKSRKTCKKVAATSSLPLMQMNVPLADGVIYQNTDHEEENRTPGYPVAPGAAVADPSLGRTEPTPGFRKTAELRKAAIQASSFTAVAEQDTQQMDAANHEADSEDAGKNSDENDNCSYGNNKDGAGCSDPRASKAKVAIHPEARGGFDSAIRASSKGDMPRYARSNQDNKCHMIPTADEVIADDHKVEHERDSSPPLPAELIMDHIKTVRKLFKLKDDPDGMGGKAQVHKDVYINPFDEWGMPDFLTVKLDVKEDDDDDVKEDDDDDFEKSKTVKFMNIVIKTWREKDRKECLYNIFRDIYFAVTQIREGELGIFNADRNQWGWPIPDYSRFLDITKGDVEPLDADKDKKTALKAETKFVKSLFKYYATSIYFHCLSEESKVDPDEMHAKIIGEATLHDCLVNSSGMNISLEELKTDPKDPKVIKWEKTYESYHYKVRWRMRPLQDGISNPFFVHRHSGEYPKVIAERFIGPIMEGGDNAHVVGIENMLLASSEKRDSDFPTPKDRWKLFKKVRGLFTIKYNNHDYVVNPFKEWGMSDFHSIQKVDEFEKSDTGKFMNVVIGEYRMKAIDNAKIKYLLEDILKKARKENHLRTMWKDEKTKFPHPSGSFSASQPKREKSEEDFVKFIFKYYAELILLRCIRLQSHDEDEITKDLEHLAAYKIVPCLTHHAGMNAPGEQDWWREPVHWVIPLSGNPWRVGRDDHDDLRFDQLWVKRYIQPDVLDG